MSFLTLTLKTELTCIPSMMHELLGTGFNNTLCNEVTWLLIFWFIIHSFYRKLIYLLLKQFGFLNYERLRLAGSLWNLTIYGCFLSFYLLKKDVDQFSNFKSTTTQHNAGTDLQASASIFAVLCSFHMFMGYWKGIEHNSLTTFLKFEAFAFVCIAAYMLDFLGVLFTMTALVSVSVIFQELSRTSHSLLKKPKKVAKVFILALFTWTVLYYSITYFIAIPIVFILPIGVQILEGRLDLIPLLAALLIWLGLSGYNSVTHKLIIHWTKHLKLSEDSERDYDVKQQDHDCVGNMLECALFPPRQDVAYILSIYRSEAKYRQKQMVAKRKPKNKSMIIQTLKCMMAIKRKLCEKKANQISCDQKEDPNLSNDVASVDASDSSGNAIKKSSKHFKFPDASSLPDLQELKMENGANEIEKREDETELHCDELTFENPLVDTDDLADKKLSTNSSDSLGDISDTGEAPHLDASLSEKID